MNTQRTSRRVSGDLGYLIDWYIACRVRVNVLVIGPHDTTMAMVRASRRDMLEPVIDALCHDGLRLPAREDLIRTLVLQDVGRLSLVEQKHLEVWLRSTRVQVISTSPTSLLPLVQAGTFVDTLYYRLNVVCLEVAVLPPSATESAPLEAGRGRGEPSATG